MHPMVRRCWAGDYPVLRFSDAPEIAVEIIATPGDAALGAARWPTGPTAAALGNALAHALGVRVRRMPLTPDRNPRGHRGGLTERQGSSRLVPGHLACSRCSPAGAFPARSRSWPD